MAIRRSFVPKIALAVFAVATAGCGGGAPLLHPARTLPRGDVRASGGISAHVTPGSLGEDLRRARAVAAAGPSPAASASVDHAKGALVSAAIAPGLAPFVGARVGLGSAFEGGLAYTGRAVRADMRRSFDDGPWSLSLGLGVSAALYGRAQGVDLPGVDLAALHGYGADLPALVGWRSEDDLYMIWLGPRGGFEYVTIEALTSEPKSVTLGAPPVHLDATRWHAGGVLGLATGFNHLHVAIEAGASYEIASGRYGGSDVTIRGLTLTPATAVWWTF